MAVRIFVFLFLFFPIWMFIEAQLFRVKKIKLKSNKVNTNLNVVFISDVHYGSYYLFNRLKRIVCKINSLNPDIVIIGGDNIDIEKGREAEEKHIKVFCREISNISSKCGVLYVLGNHDYYLGKSMELLIEELCKSNIQLLKNSTELIEKDESSICVHGLDDFLEGKPDATTLNISKNKLNIMVSHNPDVYETVGEEVECCLSGHTHGGQINLFGFYAPVTASYSGQKYIKRINKKNNTTIITSKGIGCSRYPIRFFACPEIIHLNITQSGY